jgi:hypothetical protein
MKEESVSLSWVSSIFVSVILVADPCTSCSLAQSSFRGSRINQRTRDAWNNVRVRKDNTELIDDESSSSRWILKETRK